jgi:hypothetical protein
MAPRIWMEFRFAAHGESQICRAGARCATKAADE